MSGVSVSGTPVLSPALAELLTSTESVQVRIDQYVKARDEALKAVADLNLGREAAAALVDSKNLRDEADRLQKQAKDAADAALNVLREASAKATQIMAEATTKAQQSDAAIASSAADHQSWIDRSTAEVKAKQDAVAAIQAELAAAKADYEKKANDAVVAQRLANDAEARANEREVEAQAIKSKLAAAVAGLTGASS